MSQSGTDEIPQLKKKSRATKIVPIVVIVLLVVGALVVVSRPTPGRRTTTDTSVHVVVSAADGSDSADYQITLQEGGDPGHEADHIIEPLLATEGVATATLDWSSGLVLTVTFDPEVVSAQEIANILAASGYLSVPEAQ